MNILSHWKVPVSRYGGTFKIVDKTDVNIFMEECLQKDCGYEFPDVNDKTMYYNIDKDNKGKVTIGHTKYGDGLLPTIVMEDDDVDLKIYKARRSINEYFFKKED